MSKAYNTAYLLPGREWGVDSRGAQTLSCKYEVLLAEPIANNALPTSITYLPEIGTAHPSFANLVVKRYKFAEGEGSEKTRVIVTVEYEALDGIEEEGESEGDESYVEQMGWRSGSVQRDLATDAVSGEPLLNTAGQPFDSVPQVDRPLATWYKVWKSKTRHANYVQYQNKINNAEMTIAGQTVAKWTARCVTADEERLIGDPQGYNYRYSVEIQILSNEVELNGANTKTECGWNVAVLSTGTMENVPNEGLRRIMVKADDGVSEVPVAAPVLLDGNGRFIASNPQPYTMMFHAYSETAFPAIFTSEGV